jgi:hypothetical protein
LDLTKSDRTHVGSKEEMKNFVQRKRRIYLTRFRVLGDIGCETDSRRTLARGVHATRRELDCVLQKLRLAGSWVATQEDVDLKEE